MYFLSNVTFVPNCINRNHSHERSGSCGSSPWIPRNTCYYCGKWDRVDSPYPCEHYQRGSALTEIKRINAQKGV